ncbi:MAG: hypothetical protein U0105_24540 [Candidatus Obscuribacterales bacterium]
MSFLRQHFPFMATILAMMVLLAIGGHYARGLLDHEQEARRAALRAKEDSAWSRWTREREAQSQSKSKSQSQSSAPSPSAQPSSR